MDKDSLEQIIAEKKRRSAIPDMLSKCFDQQRDFILDPARKKALLCSRRAGKSLCAGIYFLKTGLENPGCNMIYMAANEEQCKKVMYKDVVEYLYKEFKLNLEIIQSPAHCRFPNGSVLYFAGIDQNERLREKLLGSKYKLAILDEAQSIKIDVEDLINRVLGPTLIDERGTMCIMGTPHDDTNTYFYKITKSTESVNGWSFHTWNGLDNPHMKQQFEEEIELYKKENPKIESTVWFRQQIKGEWVSNSNALVYRYDRENNLNFIEQSDFEDLPDKWTYILSVDLGFTDADAFVVIAYNDTDPNLYIIEAHVEKGNDDIATGYMIQRLAQRYTFSRMIIDGASLKSVETMRQRMKLPLMAADKGKKADYIMLFNMDMDRGIIKILPQPREKLLKEWDRLIWDVDKNDKVRRREKPGLANHCFIAGTKIETNKGPVNIEEVKSGHLVLTRQGYKKVNICSNTGDKPLYKLITQKGRELIGSADHPVLVKNKWVSLSELKTGDILTCTKEHQKQQCQINTEKALNSITTGLTTEGIQTRQTESCASILPVKKEEGYTEIFGQNITGQFQTGITFIIKTKILLITMFQILSQNWHQIIQDWIRPKNRLSFGTLQKKDINGTYNTAKTLGSIDRFILWFVKYVNELLNPKYLAPKFAAITAMHKNEGCLGLMMKQEFVKNVEITSPKINIQKLMFVQDYVLSVTELKKEAPVYNLSVSEAPEYFANGILVHNCSDATLYGWRYARNWSNEPVVDRKFSEQETYDQMFYKGALNQGKGLFDQLEDDYNSKWGEFNELY